MLKEDIKDTVMVVIDGPKGCGKTEAARRISKSEMVVDKTEKTQIFLRNDPEIVLQGKKPRLIDEWQING
jgi:predicted AAA+ superfamily ATPase